MGSPHPLVCIHLGGRLPPSSLSVLFVFFGTLFRIPEAPGELGVLHSSSKSRHTRTRWLGCCFLANALTGAQDRVDTDET